MPNDVEAAEKSSINLSKIGKYDKFIDFGKDFKGFYIFTTDLIKKKELNESDCFLGMENMKNALNHLIEEKLKENEKLQQKIKIIELKAKARIEKLKEKPKKKLQKEYGYERFEAYFEPKLDS